MRLGALRREDREMVGLADAIHDLQAELSRVMQEVGGPGSRLRVRPVEVEFQLVVMQAPDGRAKFSVDTPDVALGGGGVRSNIATHRLKLAFDPLGGEDIVVAELSDRPPGPPIPDPPPWER